MISVLLIFAYLLGTTYLAGFGIWQLLHHKVKCQTVHVDGYLMTGFVTIVVYAQIYSLFDKVGLRANLLLCAALALLGWCLRRQLREHLRRLRFTITPVRTGVMALLLLLFAYGTSRGILHYDTALYHAQSIHWLESYRIIPGLGNLHSRLAYNSAAFPVSALYSFSFLGGQSYHCVAGFLAFCLCKVCADAVRKDRARKPLLSDLARLTCVYYLMNIFKEMISPSSDYFMVLLVFYIVIRYLDLIEKGEKSYLPYAMLCVLCACNVTVKLSAAMLLLLTIKPAVMMLREKRILEIIKFLLLGVGAVLPFLIRNVILSGWMVYPVTAIDLFDVDWKIPVGMAEYDAREIKVWGRGYTDVAQYEKPLADWLPDWFAAQSSVDKVFLLLAGASLVILILALLYMLWKKKWQYADWMLVSGTMAAAFLFWMFSAPLIRYGCVYVWMTPVLILGGGYLKFTTHFDRYRIFYIILILAGCYKAFAFGRETAGSFSAEYMLTQKDYENFKTQSYELHGYTFYYPEQGDQTGYEDFPAAPIQAEDIFRGTTLEDGFQAINGVK